MKTVKHPESKARFPILTRQILISLVLVLLSAPANGYDRITLKSGKVIECYVLNLSGGRFKIQTPTGEIYEGDASLVQSIDFESHPQKKNADPAHIKEEPAIEVTGSLGPACETPVQKAELVRFAGAAFERPIQSITLFRTWMHPSDQTLAKVNFKHRKIQEPYYESSYGLVYHKDLLPKWPPTDKDGNVMWGPKENDAVSGPWFTDSKIESGLVVRYQLNGTEIFLGVPNPLGSTDTIRKLLLSIEGENYHVEDSLLPRVARGGEEGDREIDVKKILDIRIEEVDGKLRYEVQTSSGTLSGEIYIFIQIDGGFRLVGMGHWVS